MAAAAITTMTSSAALLVVLLIWLCTASSLATNNMTTEAAAQDLVATACANATADKCITYRFAGPGLTRQSCESALRSEKRSAAAKDPRDLALIALHLLRDATIAAQNKVEDALSSTQWDEDTTMCLQFCQVDYEALLSTVHVCHTLVHEYGHTPRSPQDELEDSMLSLENELCSTRLRNRAAKCWYTLGYLLSEPLEKALWKEVVEATTRANLAKAMVERMNGGIVQNLPKQIFY